MSVEYTQKRIFELAEDIGDGYRRTIITLERGDTAWNPESTKPHKVLRGPGKLRYLIHPSSIHASWLDESEEGGNKHYSTGTPNKLYDTKGNPDGRVIYSTTMANGYAPGEVIKNPDDSFTARRNGLEEKDGFASEREAVRWMLTSEAEDARTWAETLAEMIRQFDAE